MEQLPQQLVNGLWQGSALALFAAGYTLVFGVLKVINLAHGASYMWGAFIAYLCVTRLGLPLWLAVPLAMLGGGVLAALLERLAFKPLRALTAGSVVMWGGALLMLAGLVGRWPPPVPGLLVAAGAALLALGLALDALAARPLWERSPPHLAPMIASIGASIVLISLARGLFGAQVSRFPPGIFPTAPFPLPGGAVIAPVQVVVLAIALALILLLGLVIARTRTGRAMRAIAWSERTARLLGIDVDLVISQTFFVSGALAAAAGTLLGLAFNRLEPIMGNEVELAGLTVIIVGGMGSVAGAAVAAFLVGLIRVLSVGYVDSSFRDAIVYALLILVLLVRPSGLLGHSSGMRT